MHEVKQNYNIKYYISISCFILAALFLSNVQGYASDTLTNNQPVREVLGNDTIFVTDSARIIADSIWTDSTRLYPINDSILTDSTGLQITPDTTLQAADTLSKKELRKLRRQERRDTTFREKPTELEYYDISDTLKAERIIMWNANHYFNSIKTIPVDTSLSGNQTDLTSLKKDVGVTDLGVTGSATILRDYFKRETNRLYPFFDPYTEYVLTPDNQVNYNTKTTYSDLSYYTSGAKRVSEDNIKALLTRNISPAWNVGLQYHKQGAKGQYLNQGTSVKSFTMFTSYLGKRYVAHAGYIYNAITNKENGGIRYDSLFTDTTLNPGAIDVNLQGAVNKLRSNTFYLTHSYGVPIEMLNKNRDSASGGGTMVYFGHSLEYSRYKRIYTDGVNDTATHYYPNHYLSETGTYDSTSFSHLNNKAFIRLQPWSADFWISKIDGGIGYRFENYYAFDPSFYLYGIKNTKHSTAYVYGGASGIFRQYFQWNAFVNYHFTGLQQNDLMFDASARVSLYPIEDGIHIQARFLFDNREQSYFTQKYFSNHVKWDNSFDKTQETKIMLSLSVPHWNFEAGFNNSLINKALYYKYDTIAGAQPAQASDVVNITSVYAEKKFRLWLFHFDHRLLMQLTSDKEVMPLPSFSGNIKYYLQSEWVKNVLNTQVGFDVYYNTKFYDYAYNPATGMFHTQSERKLGNYPWIDLFANFQWKRVNLYVKFTNAADGMIGERDYFSALHYPRNKRMLRWGLRWRFYN